jgi:enoyl-CoA hydratase
MEVTSEKRGHAAWITINRPHRRNALAIDTMNRLAVAFMSAADDPSVRVIVLTGAGTEAFCAGVDLKEANELAKAGQTFPQPMTGSQRNLFELILETPKPTVAAINGAAIGGGCELALACDLRVAVDDAQIGLPEALTRAQSIGLINRVWSRLEFAAAVQDYVDQISGNAPLTLQRYKQMATKGWEMPVHSALRLNVGPNPYTSEDRVEGVRAFVEKRKPRWQGK